MSLKMLLLTILGVCGLKMLFPSVLSRIHTLFKDYLKYRELVKEEQKQKDLEKAKEKLNDATSSGDLNDLIDAAKKLGEVKNK